MRWKSFLRFFTHAWRQARTPIRKRPDTRYWQLKFDLLEQREMLSASPPTIVQAGILPVTGTTTSATPTLQVEFSDSMTNSALSPSNYVLLGSTGTLVPITNVTFVSGTTPSDDEVQLTYNTGNAGNVLEVDTYTMYVRGNNLFSATTGLAVSQPGQLFAANSGRDELSLLNPLAGAAVCGRARRCQWGRYSRFDRGDRRIVRSQHLRRPTSGGRRRLQPDADAQLVSAHDIHIGGIDRRRRFRRSHFPHGRTGTGYRRSQCQRQ
jgi:hypothetical protein